MESISMFKKSLLVMSLTAFICVPALAADSQGAGKITFKGQVIDSPCSIAPGDEDLTVNLGEVATTVLNSGDKQSLAEDFTIHLQDCILTDAEGTATDKVKITFTSSDDTSGTNLLKNTFEGNIGGATGVGVRLLDEQNQTIALNTALNINFPDQNSYQELNFKARMEAIDGETATPGNLNAQVNYILDYK